MPLKFLPRLKVGELCATSRHHILLDVPNAQQVRRMGSYRPALGPLLTLKVNLAFKERCKLLRGPDTVRFTFCCQKRSARKESVVKTSK